MNVTYIDDLLDLDDPAQKGAYNKVIHKNSIKSLPDPNTMGAVPNGQLIESFNEHGSQSPMVQQPGHSGQRIGQGTRPPRENMMGGPSGLGGMGGPPGMGQGMGPGMGPPGMGQGMSREDMRGHPGMSREDMRGHPGMGPPGMRGHPGMSREDMRGHPGMGPPGMGPPGMGPPGMGPPGMRGHPGMGQPGMSREGMMGMNRQQPLMSAPDAMPKINKRIVENYKNELSCREIADHVSNCPICSKLYRQKRTGYIIAIIVLVIVNLILLNKVFASV